MAAPTALPTRIPFLAATSSYYVDGVSGDDTRSAATATNAATPWKTLQHALEAVPIPASGANLPQEIVLRGTGSTITDTGPGSAGPASWLATNSTGTYQPSRSLAFPADSPLTIRNFAGERALIPVRFFFGHGDTNIRFYATPVNGRRGIVFDPRFGGGSFDTVPGMTWVGTTNFEACGLEIRNCIWNALGGGLYVGAHSTFGPSVNPIVWGCYIHHCGGVLQGGHGIYWGGTTGGQPVGVSGGGVINSRIQWNMDDNLSPHNCSVGSVFAHNLLLGWGGGWTGSAESTTPLTDSGGTRSFTDGMTFFAATSGQQSSNNIIVNSILAFNNKYGLNQFDSSSGGGNVEKNNCYFGNPSGSIRDASNTWQLLSTLRNNDPLFVSRQAGDPASDFHLQNASPCIGAADVRFIPADDFDFNTRTGKDIGPYASAAGAGGGGGGASFPVVVGDFTEGTANDSGYGNTRTAMQVTVPDTGIAVQEIHIWMQTYGGAPTARAGIYDDTAGAPGSLLAVSADQVLPANTVQEAVFPVAYTLQPGSVVWLAAGFDIAGAALAPSTVVLDTFSRVESPLSTGWAGPAVGGDTQLQADGVKAGGTAAGANNSSYWTSAFNADQEAYFDINAANADQRILLRLSNPGVAGGWNAFECQFKLDTNVLTVRDVLSGATNFNRIGPLTPAQTMSTATRGLFRVSGGATPTLTVAMEFAGVWTQIGTYTFTVAAPAALQGGGYIAARIFDTLGSRYFDNFGGGNYVAAPNSLDALVNPGTHVRSAASGALPASFGAVTVDAANGLAVAAYGTAVVPPVATGSPGHRAMVGVGT